MTQKWFSNFIFRQTLQGWKSPQHKNVKSISCPTKTLKEFVPLSTQTKSELNLNVTERKIYEIIDIKAEIWTMCLLTISQDNKFGNKFCCCQNHARLRRVKTIHVRVHKLVSSPTKETKADIIILATYKINQLNKTKRKLTYPGFSRMWRSRRVWAWVLQVFVTSERRRTKWG